MPESIFASGLGPGPANFSPLTPLRFLSRSAAIDPQRTAIIHGPRRISYREFDARARPLASALAARGIGEGDTVAVVLPNGPAMLEARQGVPALGAVLNAINTRLDARTIAYILAHGEAKALPRFAVPQTVVFGPLPTTATGKIQKFELRERVHAL
jgi:fatty-acyl-CoA synthase